VRRTGQPQHQLVGGQRVDLAPLDRTPADGLRERVPLREHGEVLHHQGTRERALLVRDDQPELLGPAVIGTVVEHHDDRRDAGAARGVRHPLILGHVFDSCHEVRAM